ncbi:MAG: nucleotidyltransferase [Desulfurococcaceae archaeon]
MNYTVSELALVLKEFIDAGVKFVLIGDTVVQLRLGRKELEGDLDLFVLEPSIIFEEEFYINLAEEKNWVYTRTEAGTPRIIAKADASEITVELYENLLDIYIPVKFIDEAKVIEVNGVKVKSIGLEEYFILKARQGVNLNKLSKYLRQLKKLDRSLIERALKYMPEEDEKAIVSRLKDIGILL